MNYFNQLYLTVFNRFKASLKQRANTIALFYVSIVEIAIMLLLGTFFIKFLDQMKVVVMNGTNAWLLFIIVSLFIHFKNWLNYSGRKRLILNAKLSKRKDLEYSLFILISLPFGLFGLSLMMLKVL
jgi:ABC-type multidrug transport system fused ATPase/permease subunit